MFVINTTGREIAPDFEKLSPEKPSDNFTPVDRCTTAFLLDQETTRIERNPLHPTVAVLSQRQCRVSKTAPIREFRLTENLNTFSCQNRETEKTPTLVTANDGVHLHPPALTNEVERLRSTLKRTNETWISAGLIQNKTRTKNSSNKNGKSIIKQLTEPQ